MEDFYNWLFKTKAKKVLSFVFFPVLMLVIKLSEGIANTQNDDNKKSFSIESLQTYGINNLQKNIIGTVEIDDNKISSMTYLIKKLMLTDDIAFLTGKEKKKIYRELKAEMLAVKATIKQQLPRNDFKQLKTDLKSEIKTLRRNKKEHGSFFIDASNEQANFLPTFNLQLN